jgi:hypothetical protein
LLAGLQMILTVSLYSAGASTRKELHGYFCWRAKEICIQEMKQLSNLQSGFHLGATKLTTEQLDIFQLGTFVTKYRTTAPNLWIILCTLLQAQPRPNGIPPSKILGEDLGILERHAGMSSTELIDDIDNILDWSEELAMLSPGDISPAAFGNSFQSRSFMPLLTDLRYATHAPHRQFNFSVMPNS